MTTRLCVQPVIVRFGNSGIINLSVTNMHALMKKLIFNLLLLSVCCASAQQLRGPSTFAGVLLLGQGDGLIAGNITLTVDGGKASFQSTLFQTFVTGTSLEPALVVQHKVIPCDLGTGTPGSFRIEEFLGPIPGMYAPPPCGGFPGIDPGFGLPIYSDGTRFSGSFTAFSGLENLLRTKGGTFFLQIHGSVAGLQDPSFNAPLINVTPPSTNRFTATLSGRNEVPPNSSPYSGNVTFTLTGNCLSYNLAVDFGLSWTAIGIFGPTVPHKNSTNFIANLDTSLGVLIPGEPGTSGQVIYTGVVSLDDDAVSLLKKGNLYMNFLTVQFPHGEIRGQILPACADDQRRPKLRGKEKDRH